jgi:beta-galactosidase/beta-glucuronidase
MPTPEHAEHRLTSPHPQRQRPGCRDLSGTWRFSYDDADTGRDAGWQHGLPGWREIVVPFPPESPASGVHDTGKHPVLWYERDLELEPPPPGRRVLLHFGAVDYSASVWLNGVHLTDHEGGHSSFTVDATHALHHEPGPQRLSVRAVDREDDLTQPRGKQDWRREPHNIWYHRTSGIWQPVWLEEVPDLHLVDLHWTPDPAGACVRVQARLSRQPEPGTTLQVVLSLAGEELARHSVGVGQVEVDETVSIPAARNPQELEYLTWRPESPVLIDADVSLAGPAGADPETAPADRVRSYFGLRSVGTADGRFLLNDRPYFLRLVLSQGYWPESHLAAPDRQALRREVELIKALGFNGVRVHQKVEDPELLYWCDRLGLLVWAEMPSAYAFTTRAVERLSREWTEVVLRDRGHPCIVTWVPLNESWGVSHLATSPQQRDYATMLFHLTKALDPSRPVISNDGWEHTTTDLIGVHDYGPDPEALRHRYADQEVTAHQLLHGRPGLRRVLLDSADYHGQPVVVSEFGGLSYQPDGSQPWFGYATVPTPDALLKTFEALVDALLASPTLAGFCYTQLADTEQENNGLVDVHRTPKVPAERIQAALRRAARSHPFQLVEAERAAARQASAVRADAGRAPAD